MRLVSKVIFVSSLFSVLSNSVDLPSDMTKQTVQQYLDETATEDEIYGESVDKRVLPKKAKVGGNGEFRGIGIIHFVVPTY